MKNPSKAILLDEINLQQFLNASSNFLKCPWNAGEYFIRNLSLHANPIRSVSALAMPIGEYRIDISLEKKDDSFMMASVFYTYFSFVDRPTNSYKIST